MTKLTKIITAVARERGGIVDLKDIKSDVLIGLYLKIIDNIWTAFDAGWVSPDIAEGALQEVERARDQEIIARASRPSVAERVKQARYHAEHQARRGVRKVRGTK